MAPVFQPFGLDHLAALVATALVAAGSVRAARRGGPWLRRVLRGLLGTSIAALVAWELGTGWREGWLGIEAVVPLHLCDAALVLTLVALARPRLIWIEVLYFWALSGTLLALLTPDVARGFPSLDYFVFFGLHGLVVAAVALLVFGLGFWPRPGAWRRALALTVAFAGLASVANLALGTNYMYLRAKPAQPTLLDHMGPWPIYIAAGAVLAAALFRLLELPLAALRRRAGDAISADSPGRPGRS